LYGAAEATGDKETGDAFPLGGRWPEGPDEGRLESNLKTGWNLVGVPVSVGKNVAKLPTSVLEVKDLSDAPVDILQPGKAYFINVSADTTVEW
ncbi:MAG: hypothetical protein IKI25_03260, partial [Bacteroidales bacterium]|nr:hypothetical protein [Bacteroidales bacterium]